MRKSLPLTNETWIDPDDAPVWTEDQFHRAGLHVGDKELRRANGTWSKSGRPPSANPKQQVTLRLDPDVITAFRATGRGWQSRINAELRKALGI